MVSAKDALKNAVKMLKDSNIDEALHEARLLFKFATNLNSLLLSENDVISDETAMRLSLLCEKRATRYPLQYILGKWPFMDFDLFVGEGVLIPRSDTETVCIVAAEKCAELKNPVVLDLCAGSGAISRGIKSLVPQADITAVELYDNAFKYLELNCSDIIHTVKYDVFDYCNTLTDNSIDVLVSNPPYITSSEMEQLKPELFFEPRTALTDESDGLSYFRFIASEYYRCVKTGGWLIFEIGYNQGTAVLRICKELKWAKVELLFDLGGNPRAVKACKI